MSFVHKYLFVFPAARLGNIWSALFVHWILLQLIQQVLGITTALYSGSTGLYRGCAVPEKVALGAKYPVVS
jgi:hypothetical protein